MKLKNIPSAEVGVFYAVAGAFHRQLNYKSVPMV
jgi:hypothetical protein